MKSGLSENNGVHFPAFDGLEQKVKEWIAAKKERAIHIRNVGGSIVIELLDFPPARPPAYFRISFDPVDLKYIPMADSVAYAIRELDRLIAQGPPPKVSP